MAWEDYKKPKKSEEELKAVAARWKKAAENSAKENPVEDLPKVQEKKQEPETRKPIPEFKIPPEAEQAFIERTNGFKVHFEAEQFDDKFQSPYTRGNKYNYRINITHPAIYPAYLDFKSCVKEAMILSDQQRFDFEHAILRELNRLDIRMTDFPEPQKEKKSYNKSYGR